MHRVLLKVLLRSNGNPVLLLFTQQKTRWGIHGLESLTNNNLGVADVALHIAQLLEVKLDNSWYQKDAETIIQKLKGLLEKEKIKK